ncbi:MAG: DUF2922 domain-containing protein [Enterococcus sp.]
MKKLHLIFTNAANNKHQFVPKIASEELSAPEVRAAMDAIVDLAIFNRNGTQLYTGVDSAKYVETIETPLFRAE